jgi:hypothetical protein
MKPCETEKGLLDNVTHSRSNPLGSISPLESPLYRSNTAIDIHVLHVSSNKSSLHFSYKALIVHRQHDLAMKQVV